MGNKAFLLGEIGNYFIPEMHLHFFGINLNVAFNGSFKTVGDTLVVCAKDKCISVPAGDGKFIEIIDYHGFFCSNNRLYFPADITGVLSGCFRIYSPLLGFINGHGHRTVFKNDLALIPGGPQYFLTKADIHRDPVVRRTYFEFLSG